MTEKYKFKPASKEELSLYSLVGEAVCAVQHIEDALSHLIVLKHITPPSKPEADELLEKHRKYTLGKAINIGENVGLYSVPLQNKLKEFLKERNWLIHKSIAQNRDEWDNFESRDKLIKRIKNVTTWAQELLQDIESDMIEFAEANGKDMSQVKAEIRKHYS